MDKITEDKKLWHIANEAERRSKNIDNNVILLYFTIAFLLITTWLSFKVDHSSLFVGLSFLSFFILLYLLYLIKEDARIIKSAVDELNKEQ